jgi:hypothetical protein
MDKASQISKDTLYVQLNERCRKYTAQLWQIPGLYLALVAWIAEKFRGFDAHQRLAVASFMVIVSLVVWVFVTQLKFYERRVVRQMQQLEGTAVSTGGTRWFLSYICYVKALLFFATLAFYFVATQELPPFSTQLTLQIVQIGGPAAIIVVYGLLAVCDRRRSRDIISEIRSA